jgi:tripartite-type tricarboxylate transporter receptor subunit TctC
MPKRLYALMLFGPLAGATVAHTQDYPTRPITFMVTAAPGGVTDVVARAVGQRLSEKWGQQIVIENRGGAAHTVAMSAVAKAAPDGYTLLVADAGAVTINPILYKGKLPYDEEKDFTPVTGLVRVSQALLGNPSLPAKSVSELIALVKSKPGEFTYGTAGIGSALHMNMLLFESMTGANLVPVHYRGASPAITDVIADHVKLLSVSISLVLQSHREGKLKIFGIGSKQRLPQAMDIPTVAEGGLPGYEAAAWFGMHARAGTPREVVMKINAEVQRILRDPAFQEKFMAPQMFESMASSPEEFGDFIKAEIAKWSKVIRDRNLKID